MSRAWTDEEVRDALLTRFAQVALYWATVPLPIERDTPQERCNGTVFSILSTLDGSGELPAFDLITTPHESDQAYHEERGENWYEETRVSFPLHEYWHRHEVTGC